MSVRVLAAPATADVSSTVAVSMPGPFVFTVLATVAVLSMVVVMIYFGFVVGSGPDVLDEVGTDSSAAESDDRTTDEGDPRAGDGDDSRAPDEEREELPTEST